MKSMFGRMSAGGIARASAGLVCVLSAWAGAQVSSSSPLAPPANGPRRADPTWVALVGGTVHPRPGAMIPGATVVMRDGRIVGILEPGPGADGKIGTADDEPPRVPMGPRVLDVAGLHVYAGFIDAAVGVEAAPGPSAGKHWNPAVGPERSAAMAGPVPAALAGSLREIGFTAAGVHGNAGVFRGSTGVVSLRQPSDDRSAAPPAVYRERIFHAVAFDTGGGGYPNSLMGAIAVVRQVGFDAAWQASERASGREIGPENALDALAKPGPDGKLLPWMFSADTPLDSLRVAAVAKELGVSAVIVGNGREYQRLSAITSDAIPHIVPVNFPRAPEVSSVGKAEGVELEEMMAWEQAPTNLRRLAAAGAPFVVTSARLENRDDFWRSLRLAVRAGLAEDRALEAITTGPAALLGVGEQIGTIEPGKRANIVLTEKGVFEDGAVIREVWIDGERHEINPPRAELDGRWDLAIPGLDDGQERWIEVSGGGRGATVSVHRGEKKVSAERVAISRATLAFTFDHEELDGEGGVYTVSATVERDASARATRLAGVFRDDAGNARTFVATRRPPSLEGVWAATFADPAAKDVPALRLGFDADGTLWIPVAEGIEDFKIATPTWDGRTLEFVFDAAQAGRPGEVRVKATVDWRAQPPVMRGVLAGPTGEHAFVAERRRVQGLYRVDRVDGKELGEKDAADDAADEPFEIEIGRRSVTIIQHRAGKDPIEIKATDVTFQGARVRFTHALKELGGEGESKDNVVIVGDRLIGEGRLPDGTVHRYEAQREPEDDADEGPAPARLEGIPEELPTPFGPFGLTQRPEPKDVVITNATIWPGTGPAIEGCTVILSAGKIAYAGASAGAPPAPAGAMVIDASGKHVTAGIIDAHSHTGISRGVNETGLAITSMVRIADVTDSEDVNWYRQLATGVTSVLSLHGSANAIGGQSQTNKLRWGVDRPEAMHFEGAKPGIKFALGENPRQVNWRPNTERYPRTRMGVEALIRDRFIAAQAYAQARAKAADDASLPPVRRDLELEAIAEILAGERLVHSHCYRQDEILMLTHVAREFGFKIGTFQHVLEGYKVADAVRDYSGGGSAFSDWWAFKVESADGIPQGPPLMHEVGAVVSFNSDSNELARRMNVEAGKAIKYGNELGTIEPWEAWNFVTLHPAKQLAIDGRVGALKPGMDADVVIWSGYPMSAFTRCERTFVDGREAFSLETDAALRKVVADERARLVQKLLTLEKRRRRDGTKPAGSGGTDAAGAATRPNLVDGPGAPPQEGRDWRLDPRGSCGCGWSHEASTWE